MVRSTNLLGDWGSGKDQLAEAAPQVANTIAQILASSSSPIGYSIPISKSTELPDSASWSDVAPQVDLLKEKPTAPSSSTNQPSLGPKIYPAEKLKSTTIPELRGPKLRDPPAGDDLQITPASKTETTDHKTVQRRYDSMVETTDIPTFTPAKYPSLPSDPPNARPTNRVFTPRPSFFGSSSNPTYVNARVQKKVDRNGCGNALGTEYKPVLGGLFNRPIVSG